ncbi:VCBS domain-containing protein [Noviherbaspirillum sp. Root189]|uniref:VCBS domain-containing protein n=1 Tax=Noviherbaspirillum sp. Root189 TaxID=1736487 RepID=UPI0012E3981C|nr:VCBS domain-containing protein [Noviherbaspirillum sp. Root189]
MAGLLRSKDRQPGLLLFNSGRKNMAAKTTVKVATLTGAAKDDLLTAATTGLTEEHLSANLNVLANDPGAAKLYSLLQDPAALSPTTQFPVINTVQLQSGATITMNTDGTISYDASGLGEALQSYAQGELYVDTFLYTVRMGNGALSTAKATIEIAGVNDAPTLASIEAVDIFDTPQAATDVTIQGTLSGHDVDHGAILTYGFAADVVFTTNEDGTLVSTSDYGTITLNATTGAYEFVATSAKLDALVAGQNIPVTFAVEVSDEHGATSAPVNIAFNLIGADEAVVPVTTDVPVNPVTEFKVNHGQTDVNGKVVFVGFDSNDVLTYANNYVYTGMSLVDTNGDGTDDASTARFEFTNNGGKVSKVEVLLVGYTELTEAQIIA